MILDIHEKKRGIVVNKVTEIVFSDNIHLKLDTHQLPTVNLVLRSCDMLQSGGEYRFWFWKNRAICRPIVTGDSPEDRAIVPQLKLMFLYLFSSSRHVLGDVPKVLKPLIIEIGVCLAVP